MKTFRQWFDNLSPETQEYLQKECLWIDTTSKDGYRHPDKELDSELSTYIETFERQLKNDRHLDSDHIFAAATILLHRTKDTFTTDVYYTLLMAFAKEGRDRDIIPLIDAFELREVYKRIHDYRVEVNKDPSVWHRNSTQYQLNQKLLMIEDFDNIDWSDTDLSASRLDDILADILGHDKVIEMAKDNPKCINFRRQTTKRNTIFDELFFCENGWTPEQKNQVIREYSYSEDGVRDFMERIVAVDESYLRQIGTFFIDNNAALGMHLYKEKKSQEEIDALPAGHNIACEYRYPKEYRKLFQIAACCARGNVGKAMAGTIGDAACILKMYGYDFNQIFDCLYPQYANTATVDETTV